MYGMYVCTSMYGMYACMDVCMYVSAPVCISVYLYVYVCVYVFVCLCVCVCVCCKHSKKTLLKTINKNF